MLVEDLSGWCLNCTDFDHAGICTILQNSVVTVVVIRLQGQFCQAEFCSPIVCCNIPSVFFAWKIAPLLFLVLLKCGWTHFQLSKVVGASRIFRLKHWALLNSATGAAERPPGVGAKKSEAQPRVEGEIRTVQPLISHRQGTWYERVSSTRSRANYSEMSHLIDHLTHADPK